MVPDTFGIRRATWMAELRLILYSMCLIQALAVAAFKRHTAYRRRRWSVFKKSMIQIAHLSASIAGKSGAYNK